jgi:hypothetical protein
MKFMFTFIVSAALVVVGVAGAVWAGEFDSAGVKIHYEVAGTGEPVILVHGLYSSAKMNWDWPIHVIEGAGHLNCIAKRDFRAQLAAAHRPASLHSAGPPEQAVARLQGCPGPREKPIDSAAVRRVC